MQGSGTDSSCELQAGQLWRVEDGYISIVQVGERTAHYKLLKAPDQKSALTRLIHIEALLRYMRENQASLVATEVQEANPPQPRV